LSKLPRMRGNSTLCQVTRREVTVFKDHSLRGGDGRVLGERAAKFRTRSPKIVINRDRYAFFAMYGKVLLFTTSVERRCLLSKTLELIRQRGIVLVPGRSYTQVATYKTKMPSPSSEIVTASDGN
uniref:GRAM domain-containing protein n=1 Tax=Haemonchus placei TaxID=6290 RepID=A0A0N4X5M2_HAEPC